MTEENPHGDSYNSNPYLPSTSPLDFESNESLTEVMLSLARWQIFISVIGFSMTGLMLLLFVSQWLFVMGGMVSFATVVLGMTTIIVYLVPSILLYRAVLAARAFAMTKSGTLTNAIEAQRSVWRFVGIMIGLVAGLFVVFGFSAAIIFMLRSGARF